MKLIIAILLLIALRPLSANAAGFIKSKNQVMEITGFVEQRGEDLFIETPQKIYQVNKVQFMTTNNLAQNSTTRQATYHVPASAILNVKVKSKQEKK